MPTQATRCSLHGEGCHNEYNQKSSPTGFHSDQTKPSEGRMGSLEGLRDLQQSRKPNDENQRVSRELILEQERRIILLPECCVLFRWSILDSSRKRRVLELPQNLTLRGDVTDKICLHVQVVFKVCCTK